MNKKYLFLVFISALLISLTRYPIKIFSYFSFIAFIPLYHSLIKFRTTKEIFLASIIYSVTYNILVLHWISLVTIGGYLGTFLLFAIYFFILFFLINRVSKKFPKFYPLIFISFFISFEYLQNFGEFSFPWFNIGYSLSENLTLIQVADIGGVFFVSLLILLFNILLYQLIFSSKKIKYLIFIMLIIFFWSGYGKYRLANLKLTETNKIISIAQGNIPLDVKWEESFFDSTIAIYKKLTLRAIKKDNANLVIWPESAITEYFLKNFKVRKTIVDFAMKNKINIFSGFEDYDFSDKYKHRKYLLYNAASQINKNGYIQKPYYKIKLVPFGERMPFLKIFPFLWKLHLGQANFDYGKEYKTFKFDRYKYSSLICFEIAFPYLTKNFSQKGTEFFVNITNDAWFKKSIGTYQHKMMTVFRAIETRKQIYRSANTGYSIVVSPTGKILASTKLYERKVISYPLLIYSKKTIFTKYLYLFPFVLTLLNLISCLYYLKEIIIKKG